MISRRSNRTSGGDVADHGAALALAGDDDRLAFLLVEIGVGVVRIGGLGGRLGRLGRRFRRRRDDGRIGRRSFLGEQGRRGRPGEKGEKERFTQEHWTIAFVVLLSPEGALGRGWAKASERILYPAVSSR